MQPGDVRARLGAFLLAAVVAGCSSDIKLEPLPVANRYAPGELRKGEPGAEVTDARAVQRALDFANTLRQGAWSAEKVEHSSCGTVVLVFREQDKPVGYLALDGERFFTNAPKGEVMQAATAARIDEFLALLPRWYERNRCLG